MTLANFVGRVRAATKKVNRVYISVKKHAARRRVGSQGQIPLGSGSESHSIIPQTRPVHPTCLAQPIGQEHPGSFEVHVGRAPSGPKALVILILRTIRRARSCARKATFLALFQGADTFIINSIAKYGAFCQERFRVLSVWANQTSSASNAAPAHAQLPRAHGAYPALQAG